MPNYASNQTIIDQNFHTYRSYLCFFLKHSGEEGSFKPRLIKPYLFIIFVIDFAVISYPGHLLSLESVVECFCWFRSLESPTHVQDALTFNGSVLNTLPVKHLGHFKAPKYVSSSVGSVHRLQSHKKNLFSSKNSRRLTVF